MDLRYTFVLVSRSCAAFVNQNWISSGDLPEPSYLTGVYFEMKRTLNICSSASLGVEKEVSLFSRKVVLCTLDDILQVPPPNECSCRFTPEASHAAWSLTSPGSGRPFKDTIKVVLNASLMS